MNNQMKISVVGGDREDEAGKGKNQPHHLIGIIKVGSLSHTPLNVSRPPRWCNLVQQQTKSLTMGVGRNPYLIHTTIFIFYLMVCEQILI